MAAWTFDFERWLAEDTMNLAGGDSISRLAGADASALARRREGHNTRTVVCRYWLKGLCMKMDDCLYLHEYDEERMPECRFGSNCHAKDCNFKHVAEEEKPECGMYTQVWCARRRRAAARSCVAACVLCFVFVFVWCSTCELVWQLVVVGPWPGPHVRVHAILIVRLQGFCFHGPSCKFRCGHERARVCGALCPAV